MKIYFKIICSVDWIPGFSDQFVAKTRFVDRFFASWKSQQIGGRTIFYNFSWHALWAIFCRLPKISFIEISVLFISISLCELLWPSDFSFFSFWKLSCLKTTKNINTTIKTLKKASMTLKIFSWSIISRSNLGPKF